jgi:hypothetical protein
MLETPHSLLGAAVGGATGNPWLAVPAATASHFAGDLLPHWNPSWPFRGRLTYAFVIGDFLLALALVPVFWLLFPDRPEVAVGAFFGCVPDIILAVYFVLRQHWLKWYVDFHGFVHWEVSPKHGIWPQTVVSLLAIWYLTTL